MSWFKWRAQKAPTAVERAIVHILDVAGPERREFWQIGKDVGRDLYERYKAPNDHLYALINYVAGEPKLNWATKNNWDLLKAIM